MIRTLAVWATRKRRGASAVWATQGPRGVLSAARHWLFYRATYARLALDLDTWAAGAAAQAALDISRGDAEALPTPSNGWRRLPLEFQLRIPGRRYYLVRSDGDVAHISWVLFPGDRSRFLALGRGEVEITDSHTTPAFRGRGMYKQVLTRILTDMKREGFRTAYAHVLLGNQRSLRAMRAVGFRQLELVSARRLAGVYWTRS